jgi:hypothetical protein
MLVVTKRVVSEPLAHVRVLASIGGALLTPGEALIKQIIRMAPKAQAPQGPRRRSQKEVFLGGF